MKNLRYVKPVEFSICGFDQKGVAEAGDKHANTTNANRDFMCLEQTKLHHGQSLLPLRTLTPKPTSPYKYTMIHTF